MAIAKKSKKSKSSSSEVKDAPVRIVTGKCRSSYMKVLQLVRPDGADENTPKTCSTSLFIPKKDKKTVKKIKAAIDAAARKRFGNDTKIFSTKKLRNPLHDGDELMADPESSIGKEAKGCYIVTAKGYKIPQVVNRQAERITDFEELEEICVSGYYFYFSLTFKAFDVDTQQGKSRGVRCILNNLMFVGEGERLDGGKSAEEDFKDFAVESDDDEDDWDEDDDLTY